MSNVALYNIWQGQRVTAHLAIHTTGSLRCGQFHLPDEDASTDHNVSVGADVLADHNLVKGGPGADYLFSKANIPNQMRDRSISSRLTFSWPTMFRMNRPGSCPRSQAAP